MLYAIYKYGLICLLCIAAFANSFAQSKDSLLTGADTTSLNHAEKLKLFRKVFKDSLPDPVGYVNDYAHLYTEDQKASLDSLIAVYEAATSIEIALVSFDTAMVAKKDFEKLTLALFNKWGVGKKGKDNGILIGICSGYRIMRIENGYGIEQVVSNEETKTIIDTAFTPFFKQNKYFEGTLNGLKDIMKRLR